MRRRLIQIANADSVGVVECAALPVAAVAPSLIVFGDHQVADLGRGSCRDFQLHYEGGRKGFAQIEQLAIL